MKAEEMVGDDPFISPFQLLCPWFTVIFIATTPYAQPLAPAMHIISNYILMQ